MERQLVGPRPCSNFFELAQGDRTQTVRSYANLHAGGSGQRLHVVDELPRRFIKANLARVRRQFVSGSKIRGAQQHDPYPDGLRGGDDLLAEQVGIVIRASTGRIVEVVKLSHGGGSAQQHFEKGVPRQDQKSRPLIARDSDLPRISRWKEWECALTKPGSRALRGRSTVSADVPDASTAPCGLTRRPGPEVKTPRS